MPAAVVGQALNEPRSRPVFELLHLWTSPLEQPALDTLKDAIGAAGIQWQEHRVNGNFYGVRRELADRMALRLTPTAVFWIGGSETESLVSREVFRVVDDPAIRGKLSTVLEPEITEVLSKPNGMLALPLVVHLQNVAIINDAVLRRAGVSYPKSWDQFLAIAPRIKAAGFTPIAVSGERWLFRFLLLSLVADQLAPDDFQMFLSGAMERSRFMAVADKAFSMLRALKAFANDDSEKLLWDGAVEKVISGAAAITITGDFAAPAVQQAKDISCDIAPGNPFVLWSLDVLAFPVVAKESQGVQDAGIRALATEEALTRFAIAKGGIPVVSGINPSRLDHCSRASLQHWRSKSKVFLPDDKWRRALNIISSQAKLAWESEAIDVARLSSQLYHELADGGK